MEWNSPRCVPSLPAALPRGLSRPTRPSFRAECFSQLPEESSHVTPCHFGIHREVPEHTFDDLRLVGSLPEAGEHERAGLVQGEERLLAEIQQYRRAVAHLREAVIFVPELFGELGGVHDG